LISFQSKALLFTRAFALILLTGTLLLATLPELAAQGRDLWTYSGAIDPGWNSELTWTTVEGGGDINPGLPWEAIYPASGDTLHITNNIAVYLPGNITELTNLTIVLHNGSLDLRTHEITGIERLIQDENGQGTLRIGKADYYPAIGIDGFTTEPGSTVEYYNFTGQLNALPATYNNLLLNNTDGGNHNLTLAGNLTVNNDLTLHNAANEGTLTFTIGNSATALTLSIGNLITGAGTRLQTGSHSAVHNITVGGNLTNNGSISLSNQVTRYRTSTNGAAELTFTGTGDNIFDGSGSELKLYRLIIDKGTGHAALLDANPANLQLWYRTDLGGTDKALRIINGTLKLGDNVTIDRLAGEDLQPSASDFIIPANGCLWIDGATVNIADNEAGNHTNTALNIIGRLRISTGTLNTNRSGGIYLEQNAIMMVEGGTTTIAQLRPSEPGIHPSTFDMTGGVLNIDGSIGSANDDYTLFSLPDGILNFSMSGGKIELFNPTVKGFFAFGLDPANHNVSGGTIHTNGTGNIATTMPLFNLTIETGTLTIAAIDPIGLHPLRINNNLVLNDNTTLTSGDQDLWLAGNLTLGSGASYNHGTNTTRFFRYRVNNTGTTITNNGASPLNFFNVSLAKSDNSSYNTTKTVFFPATGTPAVNIQGMLSFDSPYQTLDLAGQPLSVRGNINVNQASRILNDPSGGIILDGTQKQLLSLNRLSSANHFRLNNTEGAGLMQTSRMGSLILTSGSLDIGNRRLELDQPVTADGGPFSASKMISTNGASGELRYFYTGSGSGDYLYPVGTGAAPPGEVTPFSWSEDFSTNVFAAGWTSRLLNNNTHWVVDNGTAYFNASQNNSRARMESTVINISGLAAIEITFDEQRPVGNNASDQLRVQYLDGGSWVDLSPTYNDIQPDFITRTLYLDVSDVSDPVNFRLGFWVQSSNNAASFTRVDNIQVTSIAAGAEYDKYTPATVDVSGPGSFTGSSNSIGVIPVNRIHPLYNPGQEGQTLLYHWKTTVSGQQENLEFAYTFNFYDADKIQDGGGGAQRPYKLIGNIWTDGASNDYRDDVDPMGFVRFPQVGFSQGDFTAGTINSFKSGDGLLTFYSRNATLGGNWETLASWSNESHDSDVLATRQPAANDLVIIAPNHTITVTTDDRSADLVLINAGAMLNLGATTGHVFDLIRGDGTLRTETEELPLTVDDLYDFTRTDNSTIEFSGAGSYTLPALPDAYYNLHITGSGTKTLADADLSIRYSMVVNQSPAIIGNGTNGNIDIAGELNLLGGAALSIAASANARTINTTNITIDNATFTSGAGAIDTLNIAGGGISITGAASAAGLDNVSLTLTGPGSTALAGSHGNDLDLYRLILCKDNLFDEVSVTAALNLHGPTVGAASEKALELIAGTLILERTAGATPIDITLTGGGDDFLIPEAAALIVGGDANIVRATGNSDIDLDGLLRLEGTAQAIFDHDVSAGSIIYSTSGNAELEVADNAVLVTGGQVRRKFGSGSLRYTQTGGSVTIATVAAPVTDRGVFEILNPGSSFTHTGGSLTIRRASGNTGGPDEGDIILTPPVSDIGGDATLTISAAASQTIQINSSIPLNNLVIEGANNPTVQPITRRLNLLGNLTIDSGATYSSNDLSLTIGGNYLNNGTFTSSLSDTTYFAGTAQTLSGTGTNTFHHFVSEPVASLGVERHITITGNMAIVSGSLADDGNTITVLGNIFNSGTHGGTGKILLNDTLRQDLGGGGSFGNLEINNPGNVRLTSNITLEGNLQLTAGLLDIRNHRLTLSGNSDITATGDFSPSRMIRSNGDLGDAGIYKAFAPGETAFVFPLGVTGKYTPVEMSFDAGLSGTTVNVYPINNVHPTITDPGRVLQYYWGVHTSGLSDATGSLVFHYHPSDLAGDTTKYFSAHLRLSDDTWAKAEMLQEDKNNDRITFNYTNATDDNIRGSFLCGEDDAIPNVISVWSTVDSGTWDTPAIWNHGTVPPMGVIVVIQQPHTVAITSDRKRVYRMRLNGRLEVGYTTTGHNFGLVEGTGTLAMQRGNLPAGRWTEIFLTCEGGTVEFGGSDSYPLDSRYLHYRNLTITGSGTKTSPNLGDLIICGNLHIHSGVIFHQRHRTVYKGDITKEPGGSFFHQGWWTFFNGTAIQTIAGNFTGTEAFKSTQFLNHSGYNFIGNFDLYNNLHLRFGRFRNEGYQFSYMSTTGMSYEEGGNADTYITGRYRRLLGPSTTITYFFPIGKEGYKKITGIKEPATVGNQLWSMEYFNSNPDAEGLNTNYILSPLGTVSKSEFWLLNGPANGSAKLGFPLTGTSDIAAALGEDNKQELRIIRWNSSTDTWETVGGEPIFTGTIISGTISTTDTINFNGEDQFFTLGSIQEIDIPTATFTSINSSICEDDSFNLEIALIGEGPWEIKYSDGITESGWEVADSSPYTITVVPASTTTYTLTAVRTQPDHLLLNLVFPKISFRTRQEVLVI
jgi:hypothetical protein